jgi:uncharacterized protein YjbJ (UPF0337 family)
MERDSTPWIPSTRFPDGRIGKNQDMPNKDELKGRAKRAAGDVTDNDDLKREGKVEEAAGTTKNKIEQVADKIKEHLPGKH